MAQEGSVSDDWRDFNLIITDEWKGWRNYPEGLDPRQLSALRAAGFLTLGAAFDHIAANPDWLAKFKCPNFGNKSRSLLQNWMEGKGMITIAPCPFCANTANAEEEPVMFAPNMQAVECLKCGARGPDGWEGLDIEARAIELWNRRAA